MDMLIWVIIIFLFSTFLRVSHVVVSPHTLFRKVVTIFKWGALITIHSSKTKKWKPTDFGVTPTDLTTDKNTKVGGCFFHIPYTIIPNICLHHLAYYRKCLMFFSVCHFYSLSFLSAYDMGYLHMDTLNMGYI